MQLKKLCINLIKFTIILLKQIQLQEVDIAFLFSVGDKTSPYTIFQRKKSVPVLAESSFPQDRDCSLFSFGTLYRVTAEAAFSL